MKTMYKDFCFFFKNRKAIRKQVELGVKREEVTTTLQEAFDYWKTLGYSYFTPDPRMRKICKDITPESLPGEHTVPITKSTGDPV